MAGGSITVALLTVIQALESVMVYETGPAHNPVVDTVLPTAAVKVDPELKLTV